MAKTQKIAGSIMPAFHEYVNVFYSVILPLMSRVPACKTLLLAKDLFAELCEIFVLCIQVPFWVEDPALRS